MKGNHFALLMLIILTSSALAFNQQALAQPGTELKTITTPACGGGNVGVAFDGSRIIYDCGTDITNIHFTDLTSADLGSKSVVDSSNNPVTMNAISWDPTENRLWNANLDGAGHCDVWSVDISTSPAVATKRFTYTDGAGHCNFEFNDGLTVDTVSNTIWASPDVSSTIFHFKKDGTLLGTIDFGALTSGLPNSGLAIGLDGKLFAGSNGQGKIVEIDPSGPTLVGQFASVSGRDEDLECGPQVTKADSSIVESILSRDFLSSKIDVLEAPQGTCLSPAAPGPVHGPVGGIIIPVDMTSLFVAGAMTNAFWILPTFGGIAGAAITLFKVKRKHN